MTLQVLTPAARPAFEQIYLEAFPAAEIIPLPEVYATAAHPDHDLLVWEDPQVRGLALVMTTPTTAYVMFLAVANQARGRGLGTRILDALWRRYYGKNMVLLIEELDPAAPDYAQRAARLRFYQRNGYRDTGWRAYESAGTFLVLSRSGHADMDGYVQVMAQLSGGVEQVTYARGR